MPAENKVNNSPSSTTSVISHSSRKLMDGTFWVFAAEALMIPTGLLTAAFLTRRLGPGAYGLLTITASFIAWLEWTINSFFGRATVKLLGDTKDWKSVGIAVINLQLSALKRQYSYIVIIDTKLHKGSTDHRENRTLD